MTDAQKVSKATKKILEALEEYKEVWGNMVDEDKSTAMKQAFVFAFWDAEAGNFGMGKVGHTTVCRGLVDNLVKEDMKPSIKDLIASL